jgi:hypothetical protein
MQQMPLTLDQARHLGAAGMLDAAARNERKNGNWTTLALEALCEHVRELPAGAEFILEDVRLAIESKVPEPTDLRAWGAVTQTAIRALKIEKTERFAPAKSSHASPKALYRRGRELL